MSGETIDYELRPAKNVDRRVFVDLLSRTERWKPLQDAIYISMGGYPMSDHRMMHRRLGIENLISIDGNDEVVKRQEFNKPTEKCICLEMMSGDLVEKLEEVIRDRGMDVEARKIVWLDYTQPNSLAEQLGEFEALLNSLGEDDIVRITLNANNEALKYKMEEGLDAGEVREARYNALVELIGGYLPTGTTSDDLSKNAFPVLLSKLVSHAAEEAFPPADKYTFFPLSTITYKDGQRMITLTGIILKKTYVDSFSKEIDLERWVFHSNGFEDVRFLNVATITLKERILMERMAVSSEEIDIEKKLKFKKFGKLKASDYFDDFKEYARFYPSHAQLDL